MSTLEFGSRPVVSPYRETTCEKASKQSCCSPREKKEKKTGRKRYGTKKRHVTERARTWCRVSLQDSDGLKKIRRQINIYRNKYSHRKDTFTERRRGEAENAYDDRRACEMRVCA